MTAADAPAAWRQPEVERVYLRWLADHFGEIDMELLLTAVYNAGGRNAIFAMTQFSGIQNDISRIESRVVNLRTLLESMTQDEQ